MPHREHRVKRFAHPSPQPSPQPSIVLCDFVRFVPIAYAHIRLSNGCRRLSEVVGGCRTSCRTPRVPIRQLYTFSRAIHLFFALKQQSSVTRVYRIYTFCEGYTPFERLSNTPSNGCRTCLGFCAILCDPHESAIPGQNNLSCQTANKRVDFGHDDTITADRQFPP